MKSHKPKLSPKQREMLMAWLANDKLSIDQIAAFKNYSPALLSRLVNSAKGRGFIELVSQMPPSIIEDHILAGNFFPRLLPLDMKAKHEQEK